MAKQLDYFPAFFKYRTALEALTDEQVGRVFRAALQYAEEGTVPVLGSVEKMAFAFIRSDIDVSRIKYAEIQNKRREAANKRWGGDEDGDPDECQSMQMHQVYSQDSSDAIHTYIQTDKQTNNLPSGESTRARTRDGSKNQTGTRLTVGGPDAAGRVSGAKAPNTQATHRDEPVPPTFDEVYAYCEEAGLTHINRKKFFENYASAAWMRNGEPIRDWKALARKWDAEDADKAGQERVSAAPAETSFDTDSFFEAALARSYGQYENTGENAGK